MFRTTPVTEPTRDDVVPADVIPLSHLALDLPEPHSVGWPAHLAERGIAVVEDDIGRPATSAGAGAG
jgi:hypothetical protein